MIIDDLRFVHRYVHIHPLFKEAFEFILQHQKPQVSPEKMYLRDDCLMAIFESRPGRTRDNSPLEAHKKYIDIQYTLSGQEEIGWKWQEECTHFSQAYQEDKDIMFFGDRPSFWIPILKNKFAIFFPEDAHAPFVSSDHIHKIIVKVAIES
ncbi:YhcH/YjgK/YiaL family protein [Parachlamydia acanthamoebae]|uniref:YhcH/YjgK/YiaL family protein n=1 Tax=Parachlamydia acanthamoebae TaxID=83552 RepID=UPI0001C179FF|nr:YhcH/YjgK/YiaL family protein [Parachlamydia acanthamoebae]EFB42729.1 hypothetical protein pah_c003o006 [Parachlamydia acanthamoebae str. Hall's coccus]